MNPVDPNLRMLYPEIIDILPIFDKIKAGKVAEEASWKTLLDTIDQSLERSETKLKDFKIQLAKRSQNPETIKIIEQVSEIVAEILNHCPKNIEKVYNIDELAERNFDLLLRYRKLITDSRREVEVKAKANAGETTASKRRAVEIFQDKIDALVEIARTPGTWNETEEKAIKNEALDLLDEILSEIDKLKKENFNFVRTRIALFIIDFSNKISDGSAVVFQEEQTPFEKLMSKNDLNEIAKKFKLINDLLLEKDQRLDFKNHFSKLLTQFKHERFKIKTNEAKEIDNHFKKLDQIIDTIESTLGKDQQQRIIPKDHFKDIVDQLKQTYTFSIYGLDISEKVKLMALKIALLEKRF